MYRLGNLVTLGFLLAGHMPLATVFYAVMVHLITYGLYRIPQTDAVYEIDVPTARWYWTS